MRRTCNAEMAGSTPVTGSTAAYPKWQKEASSNLVNVRVRVPPQLLKNRL